MSLPKLKFNFRSVYDTFEFGPGNIVPKIEIVKKNAPCRTFISNLNFTRMKGKTSEADPCPIKIVFPGRIFSHVLFKLDRIKDTMKIGFIIDKDILYRMNISTGNIDAPMEYCVGGKTKQFSYEANCLHKKSLMNNDLLCLHYYIRGYK